MAWTAREAVPAGLRFAVPSLLACADLAGLGACLAALDEEVRAAVRRAVRADAGADAWALEQAVLAHLVRADNRWLLPDRELAWVAHTELGDPPNVALRCVGGALELEAVAPVAAGEAPRVRLMGELKPTVQRAARLVARLGEDTARWCNVAERDALAAAIDQALQAPLPGSVVAPTPVAARVDPKARERTQALATLFMSGERPRLFTDYAVARQSLERTGDKLVELVSTPDQAQIVWQHANIRAFLAVPVGQLVMQFPYEGCLVRKDLLVQTVRGVGAAAAHMIPCAFDLATEVHHFWCEARRGRARYWLVKPAQAARSLGLFLTRSPLAVVRAIETAAPADLVVQEYVDRPLLCEQRKFDLRVYVAVRSFVPLRAFLFRGFYARLAEAPYRPPDESLEFDVQFTVHKYVAGRQLYRDRAALEEHFSAARVAQVEDALAVLARELLLAAAQHIGVWPGSRSYYGLDVLLDEAFCPKLLECNFFPDLDQVTAYHPAFATELVAVLCGAEATPPPSFRPLQ